MSGLAVWIVVVVLWLVVPGVVWAWWRGHCRSRARRAAGRQSQGGEGGSVPSLEVWRGLSTDQQAAHDDAALGAEEAARAASERAAERTANGGALYQP